MTKILITIDWFLPGTNSGGPVRSYNNLIEALKDKCEFYVVTRNTDYCSTEIYSSIQSNAWNKIETNLHVYYISKNNLSTKTILNVFKSVEFDIVMINGIYSWYFSILPILILKKRNKPVIVSARGMLNSQAFAEGSFKKKIFLQLANFLGLYRKVKFHATNEEEKKQIQKWTSSNNIQVAPNLPRNTTFNHILRDKKPGYASFVCLSRISKEKGIHRILEALTKLDNPSQQIKLDIYGTIYQESYWEFCLNIITSLPANIKVEYKGLAESETIPEIVSNYHFLTLLSEGENFGHSILEGLSAGCPVLISDNTPWKNLKEQLVGFDLSLIEENEIQSALNFLIEMDQQTYNAWSTSAYNYALAFSNNPVLMEENRMLFN